MDPRWRGQESAFVVAEKGRGTRRARRWRLKREPALVTSPAASGQWDSNVPPVDARGTCRKSRGIQCFFDWLEDSAGLNILDLGMLSESTAKFVCSLGHSIHTASLLHSFDAARDAEPGTEEGIRSQAAGSFLRKHLDYPPDTFHGVLAWDVLQHLDEAAMFSTITHLAKILRPAGMMLCLFHRKSAEPTIPVLKCAVDSTSTFWIRETGHRESSREFSIRELELLFPQFQATHFYLTQDSLYEVLVIN